VRIGIRQGRALHQARTQIVQLRLMALQTRPCSQRQLPQSPKFMRSNLSHWASYTIAAPASCRHSLPPDAVLAQQFYPSRLG